VAPEKLATLAGNTACDGDEHVDDKSGSCSPVITPDSDAVVVDGLSPNPGWEVSRHVFKFRAEFLLDSTVGKEVSPLEWTLFPNDCPPVTVILPDERAVTLILGAWNLTTDCRHNFFHVFTSDAHSDPPAFAKSAIASATPQAEQISVLPSRRLIAPGYNPGVALLGIHPKHFGHSGLSIFSPLFLSLG
jgi:hypothetical protein